MKSEMLWTTYESVHCVWQSCEIVIEERNKSGASNPAEILKLGNPDNGFHQQEIERIVTQRGNVITASKEL